MSVPEYGLEDPLRRLPGRSRSHETDSGAPDKSVGSLGFDISVACATELVTAYYAANTVDTVEDRDAGVSRAAAADI